MRISRATRMMSGLTIIVVPTIVYGGYFLLTQLSASEPPYMENGFVAVFIALGMPTLACLCCSR